MKAYEGVFQAPWSDLIRLPLQLLIKILYVWQEVINFSDDTMMFMEMVAMPIVELDDTFVDSEEMPLNNTYFGCKSLYKELCEDSLDKKEVDKDPPLGLEELFTR